MKPAKLENYIVCLKEALTRLGVPYHQSDNDMNLLTVFLDHHPYYFSNSATPLNNDSLSLVCRDKDFANRILSPAVRMPRAYGYLNPAVSEEYASYLKFNQLSEIVSDIITNFSLPVVVKRNRGHQGQNIFLCHDQAEITGALKAVFNKNSAHYDYIALVEEYIKPAVEYRAVCLDGELTLLYHKDNSEALFVGNLSPLHFKGAKAVMVTDDNVLEKISSFLAPIFTVFPVEFAGFDIIEDEEGFLWLIEVNNSPGFNLFLRDNDPEIIIDLYQKVILHLRQKYHNS